MIPIADPQLGEREKERVGEVIDSGRLTDGPEVRAFEAELAAFCGASHGVATANGTTALHTALEALGIGPGDRVVTPSFSFVASANAVRFAGAEPVFADVDPETYNLDPAAVETVLEERNCDAILAVHLFGLPADMPALQRIADAHDLLLIEDAAQAHGAAIDGERVGTFGDAACFSFYPTKNLTTGEGGMVLTDDERVAARAARFVNHGRPAARFGDDAGGSYDHATVGHNFRMSSVLAAIGRVQLDHRLEESNERRRANAARLTEGLAGIERIETPIEPDDRRHVYHQYTIRTDDRDALQARLDDEGVGTGIYYPTPIHEQPAYDGVAPDVPVTDRATDEVLSLPVHPNLSASDLETIMTAVGGFGEVSNE